MIAFPNRENWYSFEQIAGIVSMSERTLRTKLSQANDNLVRPAANGNGRPRLLYHYTALPELVSHHQLDGRTLSEPEQPSEDDDANPVIAPDDLATAQLRLTAVKEYEERCRLMSKDVAALETCRAWSRTPRSQAVRVAERIGSHIRKNNKVVTLGGFSTAALRSWERSLYKEKKRVPDHKALMLLVPERKGNTGRKKKDIPDELIDYLWAMSTSTARADVVKAIEAAKKRWPGEWPAASYKTFQRRLRERDPRKAGKDWMHSRARFRQKHSPDIEIDWTQLGYNDLWEIDDVQKDWYAYSTDMEHLVRPYAYSVLRVATRQWVALVTSETPVIQEQIRTLVGCSLVSKQGGIPREIKFERGTVASDPHLERLLNLLGVNVAHTSMNGGTAYDGALPDRAVGHSQGKPTMEANNRRMHNIEWAMPGQVGPNERDTSPTRNETMKRLAMQAAKKGEFVIYPQPNQWHAISKQTCEIHNNKPHTGLPLIVDPETGEPRHMTPNEKAIHMKDEEITIMPANYLPMFYARGERVPVTKNGIRIQNLTFGRYDDDLREYQHVTAYVDPNQPNLAYVHELGRCIELYEKEQPGMDSQFEQKRHTEKKFKNKFQAAVARAIEIQANGTIMVDAVQVTANPFPDRGFRMLEVAELEERSTAMRGAVDEHRQRRKASRENLEFDADNTAKPTRRNRKSLSERAEKFSQVQTASMIAEDESW